MPLSPDDVQNKRFTVVKFGRSGYDEDEVDGFLDEVEAEMRRLLAESSSLKAAAEAVAAAPPPPVVEAVAAPPAEEPNETALRTLLLAQRTADDAIAQATAEAEQLVSSARVQAATLERDAQTERAMQTADLAKQRATVETEIASLRKFETEYRTRLRAYLEGQLGDLDALGLTPSPVPSALSTLATGQPAAPHVTAPLSPTGGPASPVSPGHGSGGDSPPSVPGVAPRDRSPSAAPPPGSPTAGPFSTAPAPATPTSPFVAQPVTPPRTQSARIDTDVDAASDIPSGPPAQAEDDTDDAGS